MSTLAQTYWTFTCKFCNVIRNALFTAFVAVVAFGESAGRARAASELARMGYYEEAKALMLRKDKEDV
jgi:hypothetical protein